MMTMKIQWRWMTLVKFIMSEKKTTIDRSASNDLDVQINKSVRQKLSYRDTQVARTLQVQRATSF